MNILCLSTSLTKEAVEMLIVEAEEKEIESPTVIRDYKQEVLDEYFTFG
jgi:hypothetical protein